MSTYHPKARRVRMEDAGPMGDGGPKFLVHTAEGKDLDTILEVLQSKRAAPHFVLGVKDGRRQLVQCIPINLAARGLEHPSGTTATNTANVIQVEVLEFAKNAKTWDPKLYGYLHLLMLWCHRHGGVPMESHHPFFGQHGYHRLSPTGFVSATGLVGHCHAPNQPSGHWDPGSLNRGKVLGR